MGSTFNPQILVEKLTKLNNSQQSIESILLKSLILFNFHNCQLTFLRSRNREMGGSGVEPKWGNFWYGSKQAKQVVETWARQFHSSPRDQRLAFLYLANDILQNSRRKGSEFVAEFWKVLPDALRDVIDNGDEFGRNSALRLVNILDERKVFGSGGQVLKEELVGRHRETSNRNGKHTAVKLKQPSGSALDKIVSGYQTIYAGQVNEDAMISKCRNAISSVEKVDKEINGDIKSAKANGLGVADELKGQHATLRDCIEQLTAVESSRTNLVSYLRDALQEQEMKLDLVRSQLKAAHTQSDKADNICRQLLLNPDGIQSQPDQQSAPVMYARQTSQSDDTKSAAAAMAAKLTASTSSAEMLTYVLSSLASEGVIGNSPSNDYPLQKKTKISNDQPHPYIPSSQNTQPPLPPDQQPPPPSSPPPMPPMPPMQPYPATQFVQSTGTGTGTIQYGHSISQPPPPPMSLPGFPNVGPPANGVSSYSPPLPPDGYQNYQMEGSFYSQQSAMPSRP